MGSVTSSSYQNLRLPRPCRRWWRLRKKAPAPSFSAAAAGSVT